jgi:hypothetical protein
VTSGRWSAFRPLVRAALLSLLVVSTAACGAYHFPSEAPGGTGIVSGQVTIVPCAVMQPAPLPGSKPGIQPPCGARTLPGIEIDFSGNGSTVTTRTDSRGFYSVELASGTWKVTFNGYLRILSGPATVTVRAGTRVVANYVVDSGIRYAVGEPQPVNPGPPVGVPPPG